MERQEESTTIVYSGKLSSKQSTFEELETHPCGLGQRHVQKLVQDEPVPAQVRYVWKRWHSEPRGLRRTSELHYQEQQKGCIVMTMVVHSRNASSSIYVLMVLLAGIIILTFPNPNVIKTRMQVQRSTCMSAV